jgi:hypothetical protein
VRQLERRPGPFVALVGALLQADLARRDDGDLGHGKNAVGQNQKENDGEFGTDRTFYGGSSRGFITTVQDEGSAVQGGKTANRPESPNLRDEPSS